MSDNVRQFKRVMSHFPTGVCVVTARCSPGDGCGQDLVGLTVNSFTSVSIDPLLVLICITRNTTAHEVITQAGSYTVSVLAEDQQMVSTIFAGAPNNERFTQTRTFDSPMGNPVIEGCIAYIDARIVSSHDEGDHTVFVGRVESMDVLDENRRPLVYHRGKYGALEKPPRDA